jgi:lysophospholipase L1-like esterase
MASLGDSMTTAYGSCLALVACPRNSWSTGDTPAVQSHYRRILAGNPAIKGNARNYAVNGAVAADLAAQATKAALAKPAYVTILIGANDACRRRITDMTDPDTFSAQVGAALAVLKTKVPKARILIASIPDVYQVWQLGHSHRAAIAVWRLGVCQSLLADPTSTDNVDVARRLTFRDRISTYDELLSSACRRYGAHCRYDGGAVHRTQFTLAQLSVLDFFHPNASGENRLASVSFPANFDW